MGLGDPYCWAMPCAGAQGREEDQTWKNSAVLHFLEQCYMRIP